MFEIDHKGLAELEGGKAPHQLAMEPIANVFDEYRGYVDGRKRPTYCRVTVTRNVGASRGYWLEVRDDGPGFDKWSDVWTLFGATAKRSDATVAGRFNAGDKQLIAASRKATVSCGSRQVEFCDGKRRERATSGTFIDGVNVAALMPWSKAEAAAVIAQLKLLIPPCGLEYSVNGDRVVMPVSHRKYSCRVKLPTVALVDGVMRPTERRAAVDVYHTHEGARLHELGVPVCDLGELGFPWSLDVGQKIPLPMSRDVVSPTYLCRLIGSVVEAAAMDGQTLLTEDQQGAGFMRAALDWVRHPEALAAVVADVYGKDAVRQSSDPIANAQAAASGATIVPGRYFTAETRRRLDEAHALPTSKERFGGAESLAQPTAGGKTCPRCGGKGSI